MSPESIYTAAVLVADVIAAGFSSITAYRAFSLSRALPGQVYRTRAEWIGTFSIILIAATAISFGSDSGYFDSFVSNFLDGVDLYMTSFFFVFLFAWLSSTVGVASDLDYFHRDTLRWGTMKRVFWAGVVLVVVATTLVSVSQLNPCVAASCSPIAKLAPLIYGGSALIAVILVIYASAVLFVTSRRVKEKILRSHLKWLGLFAVTLIFSLSAFQILIPVSAYFLFRSSNFLTPAERVESIPIHGREEMNKRRDPVGSPSLKYRAISLLIIGFSLFLAGIILKDDGLLKKIAPGNAEAFTTVMIIYAILFVLIISRVKLGFMLGLLSSTLWLFAQIANVLIPVNSFVTSSNVALYFPRGFSLYVLGFAPVHNPTLCPYTCPPLQYSGLISLLIQIPLILCCYLGFRLERKAGMPKKAVQVT
jgi:hypothetical protein